MNVELRPIIQKYVEASNRHDVQAIVSCFSNDAVVHDEEKTVRGKQAIKDWITRTIEKYRFHFELIGVRDDGAEVVVEIEVSGTFPGSPVALDYHFVIEKNNISSLTID
jgi:ketosteroid isomerase-like protein